MIPAEAVEAAAKAHFERGGSFWDDMTPDARVEVLGDMQAALEAAAPHMLQSRKAEAWDEGVLAADYAATGYPDNPYRPTP